MRILDIDLDFFLDQNLVLKSDNGRLPDDMYEPWSCGAVKYFLDKNCGLEGKKIQGRIVNKHHEALFFWEELIISGKLRYPFEIVHIDAHADMGMGDIAYLYIINQLLHLPVYERSKYDSSQLKEGNYIAFALALGFISRLINVIHPGCRDDIMWLYMKDYHPNSGEIEMKAMKNLSAIQLLRNPKSFNVIASEPIVRFSRIPYTEFHDKGNFDFIVLSQSPQYTPKSADALVPIINTYIENI